MIWNDHHELEGTHAFLSASQYHWLNYTNEVLVDRYRKHFATDIGTIMHEAASKLIKAGTKINKQDKHLIDYIMLDNLIPKTAYNAAFILNVLVPFVNDAIGFRMDSEKIVFYDYLAYGTADAIKYSEIKRQLRIHDLKTGESPASFNQLMIYAAYFFLEYKHLGVDPFKTETILRLYQNLDLNEKQIEKMQAEGIVIADDYIELTVDPQLIKDIMDKVKTSVNVIRISEGKEPRE